MASSDKPQRGSLPGDAHRTNIARLTSQEGAFVLKPSIGREAKSKPLTLELEQHGLTWQNGREESCLAKFHVCHVFPATSELARPALAGKEPKLVLTGYFSPRFLRLYKPRLQTPKIATATTTS
jgi:hypothetical protein